MPIPKSLLAGGVAATLALGGGAVKMFLWEYDSHLTAPGQYKFAVALAEAGAFGELRLSGWCRAVPGDVENALSVVPEARHRRSRRRRAGPVSWSSTTSAGCAPSSRTSWNCPASTPPP